MNLLKFVQIISRMYPVFPVDI